MKIYLFLGLMSAAVLFNNCISNDDNTSEPAKKLLLSKVTAIYYDNPSVAKTVC